MKITTCTAKKILDSRGVPTLEVEMTSGDFSVTASVPSGKSTGGEEALELRDADGRGVSLAIENVNGIIAEKVVGYDTTPRDIDKMLLELDGTENKSKLGANAMLGVSIAATKLAATLDDIPIWKYIAKTNGADPKLPKLFMNIINGGAHADFRLPFQEYMIVPEDELVSVAYKQALHVIEQLGKKLKTDFTDVPMGDEGGYSPLLKTIEEPFEILTSLMPKKGMFMAIDSAASEFYKDGEYNLLGKQYSPKELLLVYKDLANQFNLLSIEDPFEEADSDSFKNLVKEIGKDILIVGDDLTVTNPSIVTQMAEKKAANAVIIKPNQIGTLSQVYEAVTLAHGAGWKTIASHRSGETMDSFIADLAVGIGAYGIKAGSPFQKERKVKYDRLIEIEKEFFNI